MDHEPSPGRLLREQEFTRLRPKLKAIAYRMLGSVAEAEDAVQDAYLRFHGTAEDPRSAEAFLTTVVSRICLDRLKSARTKREQYVGPWLPEPIATTEDEVDAESVSMAVLLLLERLTPVERAAYLLHAVFDNDYQEVAKILGKSEAAVRQAYHRAKEHLEQEKPRFAPSKEKHRDLLTAFAIACQMQDTKTLAGLLTEDVRAVTDGGGAARAARRVVEGRDHVSRLFLGIIKKGVGVRGLPRIAEVNGWPCIVTYDGDTPTAVVGIETDGETIRTVHVVVNPEKLQHLLPAGSPS
jgi:RNA polymerase sigma-70 factor (ECF subfamily)